MGANRNRKNFTCAAALSSPFHAPARRPKPVAPLRGSNVFGTLAAGGGAAGVLGERPRHHIATAAKKTASKTPADRYIGNACDRHEMSCGLAGLYRMETWSPMRGALQ